MKTMEKAGLLRSLARAAALLSAVHDHLWGGRVAARRDDSLAGADDGHAHECLSTARTAGSVKSGRYDGRRE